jgi:uncharacterized protein
LEGRFVILHVAVTHDPRLALSVWPGRYAICRLPAADPLPPWAVQGGFYSVTRTSAELSVVCETTAVPPGVQAEPEWRVLAVQGPLDFSLTGIIARLSAQLAAAAITVFVVSTYDTDHVLVRAADVSRAVAVLRDAGYLVSGDPDLTGPAEPLLRS